jgi:hypothetical protein
MTWPINILKSVIIKLIPIIFPISQPKFKTKVISKELWGEITLWYGQCVAYSELLSFAVPKYSNFACGG